MGEIVPARTEEEYRRARALIEAYADGLDFDLAFQNFADELDALPEVYGPPAGAMLLLMDGGDCAGCVGVRPIGGGAAELKRMYVRPEFRGRGFGRELLDAACCAARDLGYRRVRLDTVPTMKSAIRLYRAAGFREIPPYRHNPRPGALFFEREM